MLKKTIAKNTGISFEVRKGQVLDVHGRTIVDLVCFNLQNIQERFDQARTKANQQKIFLSVGDYLISKFNNDMFHIIRDTFVEGTHDLQYGMCSGSRWDWDRRHGFTPSARYGPEAKTFPDHGCFENLSGALAGYGVKPEDIPSPFNIFQNMEINGSTGKMRITTIRPEKGATVALRALMDCLVGASACPDPNVGGQEIQIVVRDSHPEEDAAENSPTR